MAKKKTLPAAKEAATGPTPAHMDCPATKAIDLLAHKWTMHILFTLRQAVQPTRFRRLQQLISPITQKELTKRLRELERSGLVHRQVYAEVPPRVEYRLTELGGTLMPALEANCTADCMDSYISNNSDWVDVDTRTCQTTGAQSLTQ